MRALPETTMLPVRVPMAEGVKATEMIQFVPGGTLPLHGSVSLKSGFVKDTENDCATLPEFDKVTFCATDAVPIP